MYIRILSVVVMVKFKFKDVKGAKCGGVIQSFAFLPL